MTLKMDGEMTLKRFKAFIIQNGSDLKENNDVKNGSRFFIINKRKILDYFSVV
jgi:hypothetical protein